MSFTGDKKVIYLSSFRFPSWDEEYKFRLDDVKRTCYNTMYPFFVLSRREFSSADFDADPVDVKRWTELDNVRAWRDFFLEHESDFKR